jgi:TatD DNase family protein
MPSFIDSHAHLTSAELLPDADAILARARTAGVSKIINICTDAASLEAGLALQKRFPHVLYTTAATTPHDVDQEGETFFPLVKAAASQLIAIGETGLDYFYEHSPEEIQRAFLSRYFALALSVKLPLIFHCRDAFEDLFAMADREYKQAKAVLHCFTGTIEDARGVLDRGWMLSLSGIVSFKKSEALREVAEFVPLDRLLIETDAPYLAPQSRRGQRNEPAFIAETAQCIAQVKGLTIDEIAKQTTQNAIQFFAIK